MKKITVLITAAGAPGQISIIRMLRGMNNFNVIAVDSSEYVAGLYLADFGYKVPLVSDPRYLPTIKNIIVKESVDIVVPGLDEELLDVHDLAQKLNIKTTLPRREFIEMAGDKYKTAKALLSHNVKAPITFSIDEFLKSDSKNFPVIIKPRSDRGSRGVAIINSLSDLENYLKYTTYPVDKLLIQEFIKGIEYTISVSVSSDGQIIAVIPKKVFLKERSNTKFGVTINNSIIEDLCRRIQMIFRANGPFNVQLIIDEKTNSPYIFEINPRFSSSVPLNMAAGINDVYVTIMDRLGSNSLKPIRFKAGVMMTRYNDQIFVPQNSIKGEFLK